MNEKVIKSIQECQNCRGGEALPDAYFSEVFNYLESLDHFKKIKKLPNYFELMRLSIRSLNLQTFKRGDILVRQKDRGDKFFIILSGEVNIYVQHSAQTLKKMNAITKKVNLLQQQENVVNQEAIKELDYQYRLIQEISQEDKELLQLTDDIMFLKYTSQQLSQVLQSQGQNTQDNQQNSNCSLSQEPQKFFCKRVNQLKSNCTFGEFSLAKLGQRTASIIAKSDKVVTASIPYELYNIIFDVEIKFRENLAKYIQQFFPKIGDTFGVQIAYFFQEKPLLRNQVVYREGDQVNELYYIYEGNITLTKRLISQDSTENKSQDLTQAIRDRQISQTKKKSEDKTIVILQQNQFFGYESEDMKHYFSAICSATNTRIYKLNRHLLNQISDYSFHDIFKKKSTDSINRYNERIHFISQTQLNLNQVLASPTTNQNLAIKSNPFIEYQLEDKNSPANQINLLRNSMNQIALKKYHLKSKSIVSLNTSPHQSVPDLIQNSNQNDKSPLTERGSTFESRKNYQQNQNLINLKQIENVQQTNQNILSSSSTTLNNISLSNSKTELSDKYAPISEIFEYAETFQQVKKRLKLSKYKSMKKDELPQFGNMTHLNKLKKKLSIGNIFSQKKETQSTQKLCIQQSLPVLSDDNLLFGQNDNNYSVRNIPSLKYISESHAFSMNLTNPSSPTILNSQNFFRPSVHEVQSEQNLQNIYQLKSNQYPLIHQLLNNQEKDEDQVQTQYITFNNNQQQQLASTLTNSKIFQENQVAASTTARQSLETQDSSNNTSEINIFKSDKLQRGQSQQNLYSPLNNSSPLQLNHKQSPIKSINIYQQLKKSNSATNDAKLSLYPLLTNKQQIQNQQQQNLIQSPKQISQNPNINSNEILSKRNKLTPSYTQNQAKQVLKQYQNTEESSINSQTGNEEELSIAQINMIKQLSKLSDEQLFDDNTTTAGLRISSPMKSIEEERMKEEDLSFFSEENLKLNTEPNYTHQRISTQHEEPNYKDKNFSPNFLSRRNKKFYSLKMIKSKVNQKITETDIPNSTQNQQSLYFFSTQTNPTKNLQNLSTQKNENQNSSKSLDKKKTNFESPNRNEKLFLDLKISPAIKGIKNENKLSKLSYSPISQRGNKSIEKLINLNQVEVSSNTTYSSDHKYEHPLQSSQENLRYQLNQSAKYQNEMSDSQFLSQQLNQYRNNVTSSDFSYNSQMYLPIKPSKLSLNDQSIQQNSNVSSLSPKNKNKNKVNLKTYEYQTSDEAYFTNISKEDLPQNEQFKKTLQSSSDPLLKKQKGYKETLRNFYNLHKQLKKAVKSPITLKSLEKKLLPLQLNECITPKQEHLEQTCRTTTQKNRIQIALSNTSRNNTKSSSLDSKNNLVSHSLTNLSATLKKTKKQNQNSKNIPTIEKEQYTDSSYPLRINKINISKDEQNPFLKQRVS